MSEATNSQIEQLSDFLRVARKGVVFSGMGMSMVVLRKVLPEPLPMKPLDFGEYLQSEELQREAWRRHFAADVNWSEAQPSKGHRAVAHLVAHGKVSGVITQNVDNLHQVSGVPDEQIVELHGSATYAVCLDCSPLCQDRCRL